MGLLEDAVDTPVLDDFVRGRWLPILGAGFSLNARLPGGEAMPDWGALAAGLAQELGGYNASADPLDAISAYELRFDRPRLRDRLGVLLHETDAQPGDAHEAFCRLPFDVVVTTNFDFLLERQWERAGAPCNVVVDDAAAVAYPRADRTTLLKIHGDLAHPGLMTVTERDYDEFVTKKPLLSNLVSTLMMQRTPVLIGYSFNDADTRGVWSIIRHRLGSLERTGYALVVDCTASDRERFKRRGIEVISLTDEGKGYSGTLTAALEALGTLWDSRFDEQAAATEPDAAEQLRRSADQPTRVCFVSVPRGERAWYGEHVLPAVREAGLVPIAPDQIIAPELTPLAVTHALLSRSQAAIVEPTDVLSRRDLNGARTLLGPERVITIKAGYDDEEPILRRTASDVEDPASFLAELSAAIASRIDERPAIELAINEGRGTDGLLRAVDEMDRRLRARASAGALGDVEGGAEAATVRQLVRAAHDAGVIAEAEANNAEEAVLLARAAREGQTVDNDAAMTSAAAVLEILNALLAD